MANSIIQAYLNSFALPLLTMIHYSVILWFYLSFYPYT